MKVGKFILGFDALKVIIDSALDKQNAANLLAGLTMEATMNQQAAIGVACGFTSRARFVEGITFEDMEEKNGWLLELKVGPDPVVEDITKYKVVAFFAEQSPENQLKLVYRIDNPLQLGDDE